MIPETEWDGGQKKKGGEDKRRNTWVNSSRWNCMGFWSCCCGVAWFLFLYWISGSSVICGVRRICEIIGICCWTCEACSIKGDWNCELFWLICGNWRFCKISGTSWFCGVCGVCGICENCGRCDWYCGEGTFFEIYVACGGFVGWWICGFCGFDEFSDVLWFCTLWRCWMLFWSNWRGVMGCCLINCASACICLRSFSESVWVGDLKSIKEKGRKKMHQEERD